MSKEYENIYELIKLDGNIFVVEEKSFVKGSYYAETAKTALHYLIYKMMHDGYKICKIVNGKYVNAKVEVDYILLHKIELIFANVKEFNPKK